MRTVSDIYRDFRIIPGLQMHQLRVAAVGKMVCDNFTDTIETGDVVLACLFHDMGNIIKADLTTFPEFLAPEGPEHWKGVKTEFVEKYGASAHSANVAIAKEIGLPSRVVELIDGVSFGNVEHTASAYSWEQKVTQYADVRVGPYGVLSLQERLEEARARYIDSGKTYYAKEGFERLSTFVYEIERQIFGREKIAPEDINDASVAPYVEELRNYPVA
jgi:hypothetical protein